LFHVKHSLEDTISAIITPIGVGGVGVIRISGPRSFKILQEISTKHLRKSPNCAQMTWIRVKGRILDQAMVLYMKAPRSYTGQDTAEISCHGSQASLRAILGEVTRQGSRLAEPGEFTKRAFVNGKMDLSQAEAVIDLIEARTERALLNAASQMEGWLGKDVGKIREGMVLLLARIEGEIDFPDDLKTKKEQAARLVKKQLGLVRGLLATAEEGRLVREGARVAIVGRPNVGKSSLLNALIRNNRAIVSREPGTTRDTIEESVKVGGLEAVVIDTAGIRNAGSAIEREGVKRAKAEIERADLVVLVTEGPKGLTKNDWALVGQMKGRKVVVVANKVDLGCCGKLKINYPQYEASAKTGQGIKELMAGIRKQLSQGRAHKGTARVLINLRHKECLTRAEESLIRGLAALNRKDYQELLAEDLKSAIVALGEIGGEAVSEEVISQIFSRFCVGK
jgi:tRNA modification GTPase